MKETHWILGSCLFFSQSKNVKEEKKSMHKWAPKRGKTKKKGLCEFANRPPYIVRNFNTILKGITKIIYYVV